jgi:dTDP-4-amino-4,6-dideoxygalactose transaminase
MPSRERKSFELPPTAGLPISFADFTRRPAQAFGAGLKDWLDLPEPIVTCSGTAALVVALHTLRQRSPDRNELIVPAYTCPLVALAAQMAPGLRLIACDTLPASIDFDPQKLAALCTGRTLALIPTHLGGRVADISTATDIAAKHGAAVIEDAAQALGAQAESQSVGLLGNLGFFSLAVGKGLTTYEGGVLFSRHPDLHTELQANAEKMLRSNFRWSLRRILELCGYAYFYRPSSLWWAYGRKLDRALRQNNEVEAVGDAFSLDDIPLHSLDGHSLPDRLRLRAAANALERLPAYLEQSRERAARRIDRLRLLDGIAVVADRPGAKGVWPFFMLLMRDREQRDEVLQKLWRAGLGVSKLFVHALPDYDFLAAMFGSGTDCPNARDFAGRMLTLSNTHWLNDEVFGRIVEKLRENP